MIVYFQAAYYKIFVHFIIIQSKNSENNVLDAFYVYFQAVCQFFKSMLAEPRTTAEIGFLTGELQHFGNVTQLFQKQHCSQFKRTLLLRCSLNTKQENILT